MRPSIDDRHRQVVRDMKMFMETLGACNKCTKWTMETVESRKKGEVSRLDVGFWTPAGPYLKDDLFPHVKGNFRGRVIPVASVHVSSSPLIIILNSFIEVSSMANTDEGQPGENCGVLGTYFRGHGSDQSQAQLLLLRQGALRRTVGGAGDVNDDDDDDDNDVGCRWAADGTG